jgi:cytochrome b subunit of formate dehydrogenase
MAQQQTYTRFQLAQRVEHLVLLVSFSLLGLTGLIQKYAGNAVAEGLIKALGGIETVRTTHHAAAAVFTALSVYHFLVLAYKVFVRHTELTMLPGLRDATDALGELRFNLGLAKERPALPRYNYAEKAEYWAMIWGTVLMAATGFMLWNPIFITRFLPGEFIPAAKAAHGGEAVLAVLAIIVWHMYNVHLKFFNKAMWTGKMTRHEMEEEHGEELEQIEQGLGRPKPRPEALRQRQRVFALVATPVALVMLGGLYWVTTFETTAIPVAPPAIVQQQGVYSPLPTPTWTPEAVTVAAALIPHDTAGKEQCDTCHGAGQLKPYPADHAGRPNSSCTACHKPGPSTQPAAGESQAGPKAIPHTIAGREKCSMCHGPDGLRPAPADHKGRTDDTCTACHKLSPGISGTPAAEVTPAGDGTPAAAGTSAAPAGSPPAIPHDIAGDTYKDCTTCHGAGKMKPFPANHAGYGTDTCTTCHHPAGAAQPAATPTAAGTSDVTATPAADAGQGTATPATDAGQGTPTAAASPAAPPAIPHDIAGDTYKDCTTCHGAGKMKPFPANHAGYTVSMCTGCHQPTQASGGTSTAATPAAVAPQLPANHDPTADLFKDCLQCHGVGKMKPFPDSHSSYKVEVCSGCHKAAGQ